MDHRVALLIVASFVVVGLGPVAAAGPEDHEASSEHAARPSGNASSAANSIHAQAGDLLDVRLADLHPTQAVLGMDEVYYKLGRYRMDKDAQNGGFNKRFDDWCEANGQEKAAFADASSRLDDATTFRCTVAVGSETSATIAPMKTAVVGPGGQLYLTDGHHTFTAFQESPDGGPGMHVRVRITGNLHTLPEGEFWDQMEENRWVWLRDENNQPITPDQLPSGLGLANFHDDAYRGLVYFTRDIGYVVPAEPPAFQEFYWGSWLRTWLDLDQYDLADRATYLNVIKQASQAMAALPGDHVIEGLTANELGKIPAWNAGAAANKGEFSKLSKPITDSKPGKVAYALDFGSDVVVPPVCTDTVSGTNHGDLLVESGVLCLDRAMQDGSVTVSAGASLVSYGSTIRGDVLAGDADQVVLCGNELHGDLIVPEGGIVGGVGCSANH